MGRRRANNLHLPPRLYLRGKVYWFKAVVDGKPKWFNFGKDYGLALELWARETGKTTAVHTVADAVGVYLESQRDRLSPQSMERYAKSAKRLLPVFGSVALRDLEASDVYRYMREKGDVSANRDRSLLSAAYSHARRIGAFRGDDPTKALQYRNPEKPRERLVSDAELARLLVAAPPHMAHIIEFAAITGMRQGDILALRVSAATADGILYRSSKAGKLQLVRWTPALRAVWQAATQDLIGASVAFRTERRTEFTGSGFRASWAKLKARAELPDVTFHDLRAKAASEAVDATALLGHSDPKTTARHYKRGPIVSDPSR